MGNKVQRKTNRQFSLSDWEFVGNIQRAGIFHNRSTNQFCEEHVIIVNSEIERQAYEKRKSKCQEHLVNVLHVESFTNFDEHYAPKDFTVRVFLERVTVRLHEIVQLPHEAIPQLVFECLLAFKKIYEEYSGVRVTADMIGFTENKEIRVWFSSNFLDNFPSLTSISIGQSTMVEDIFKIFDGYSKTYVHRPGLSSFTKALEFIAQIKFFNKQSIKLVKLQSEESKPLTVKSAAILKSKQIIRQSLSPKKNSARNLEATNWSELEIEENAFKKVQSTNKTMQQLKKQMYSSNQKAHQRYISSGLNEPQKAKNSTLGNINSKHIKSGVGIGIDSVRTTSNSANLLDNLIDVDHRQLHLDLLDEKTTKQAKLNIIRSTLSDTSIDDNLRKVCRVYDYALKYDPLMYYELQKVKGRISKISNQYVLKKMIELTDGGMHHSDSEPVYRYKPISTLTKQESEDRIKYILQQERLKREIEPRKSDMNVSFFGETKFKIASKSPVPRGSELPKKAEPSFDFSSERRNTTNEVKRPEENKKDKQIFMKSFKEEVERLLQH